MKKAKLTLFHCAQLYMLMNQPVQLDEIEARLILLKKLSPPPDEHEKYGWSTAPGINPQRRITTNIIIEEKYKKHPWPVIFENAELALVLTEARKGDVWIADDDTLEMYRALVNAEDYEVKPEREEKPAK